jgi:hypothetical protein
MMMMMNMNMNMNMNVNMNVNVNVNMNMNTLFQGNLLPTWLCDMFQTYQAVSTVSTGINDNWPAPRMDAASINTMACWAKDRAKCGEILP